MDKELQEIVEKSRALRDKSVEDVVRSKRFARNLEKYLNAQREAREAARRSYESMRRGGGAKSLKLPAHVLDNFDGWDVQKFVDEYCKVLSKCSKLNAAERKYITQLCGQAYGLTCIDIITRWRPWLRRKFFKTNK